MLDHSLIVSRQDALTLRKNASARVRSVSSISSSGVVTAKVANVNVANSLTSPSVDADYTIMSYGSVASPKRMSIQTLGMR
jgi:hypothetical protein